MESYNNKYAMYVNGGMKVQTNRNFENDFNDQIINLSSEYDSRKNGGYIGNYQGNYDRPDDDELQLFESSEYRESIEFLLNPSTKQYIKIHKNIDFTYADIKNLTPKETIRYRKMIELEQKYQVAPNNNDYQRDMIMSEDFEGPPSYNNRDELTRMADGNRYNGYDTNIKRTLCTHFSQKGFCQFGDRCKFLHDNPRVRSQYPRVGVNNNYNNINNNYNNNTKNSNCYHYQRGYCRLGDQCKFLHKIDMSGGSPIQHHRVCREFQLNNCKFGDKCRFKHY